MYYIIYKTTNLITGKIYVGQHRTKNLNDGYIGSGVVLHKTINKYGKDNFECEILFTFDNFEDMDNKEIEIVNEDFIKKTDTYNIMLGGFDINRNNTLVAKLKGSNDKFKLIPIEEYDSEIYETPCSNKLCYKLKNSNNNFQMLPTEKYDKDIHETPSTGYTTVFDKVLNKNKRINVDEFDDTIHTKVFGGLVAKKDGKFQYVSKEEFKENGLEHCHKGKVTVYVKENGECKHITTKEFEENRDLYTHLTEGFVTGRHRITNTKRRFRKDEVENYKNEYKFSTNGQLTVYDVNIEKFINIEKDDYDKDIHKLSQDLKFKWYSENGELIIDYWGSKKNFHKTYEFPESMVNKIWKCIKSEICYTTRIKMWEKYTNSTFILENWK